MPYGYLAGVLVFGALVILTLTAPRRPPFLAALAYRVASVYNEAPFPFIYVIVISSIGPVAGGQLASPAGRVVLGLALLVILGLGLIAWRGVKDRPAVVSALGQGLGAGWREDADPRLLADVPHRPPIAKILFMPFVLRPRQVERFRNVSYGDAGRYNLLDVYHPRSQPEGAPVLIYLHGGGFYSGRKSVEARALLFRLATRGAETEVGVLGHNAANAPPFFIAHGEKDSLATVETARRFAAHLRSASNNPVVYCRAAAWAARLRPVPLLPVLCGRRRHRVVRGVGAAPGLTPGSDSYSKNGWAVSSGAGRSSGWRSRIRTQVFQRRIASSSPSGRRSMARS